MHLLDPMPIQGGIFDDKMRNVTPQTNTMSNSKYDRASSGDRKRYMQDPTGHLLLNRDINVDYEEERMMTKLDCVVDTLQSKRPNRSYHPKKVNN